MAPWSQNFSEPDSAVGLPISSIHNPEAQLLAQYLETAEVDEWLFAIMDYDWFGGEHDFGRWVVQHPRCEKAVALAAYWYSAPRWSRAYATLEEAPKHEQSLFRLHDEIEGLFAAGRFESRASLAWDPFADPSFKSHDWTKEYAERPEAKQIPKCMLVAATGRDIDYESRRKTWTAGFPPTVWAMLSSD